MGTVARSLTLRRTHTLGVIIPDLMHSFFVEIVAGFEAVVSARGYGLLLCARARTRAKSARRSTCSAPARSTASCWPRPMRRNTALLRDDHSAGTALVMIDRDDHPRVRCHRVLTDDVRSAASPPLTCSRAAPSPIAHIAGPPIVHAQRREEGYRERHATAGRRPRCRADRRGRLHGSRRLPGDEDAAAPPAVDGVFAVNDPAAIGAMKAIWDAGLRVPEDVAVVGAGDVAHSDLIRVPLTTVRWSKRDWDAAPRS